MGFWDEYNKAVQGDNPKSGSGGSGTSSFMEEFNKAVASDNGFSINSGFTKDRGFGVSSGFNQGRLRTFEAPLSEGISARMTVGSKKKKKKDEEEEERTWFQKGAFDDGYNIGDITKTILGTAGDVATGAVKGFTSGLEGIVDFGAYGVAGILDGAGKDDAADILRETTAESQTDMLWGGLEETADKYSIFGDKADAVIDPITQALGYIGMMYATAGIGAAAGASGIGATALSTGTVFASSAGGSMGEAYQDGASDDEALKHGVMKGAVDAGSELIFGGLGKAAKTLGLSRGLSSLDDIFAKKLSSKISNHFWKNAVQYGVKASAEGVEEVLAGLGSAVSKKLTYMSDKELSELIKDENLMEQFAVGMAASAIMQSGFVPGTSSGSLVEANVTGRDFISGLSQNEQKVVDKLYKDRVAEAEKGGKVSQKKKDKIYDQILNEMEKGYISIEDIESALGGKTYEDYKSISEWEDGLQKEYDELHAMKRGEMTGEQIDREAHLKEQLKNVKATSGREALKSKLSEDVFGLVKGDRLVESYNERTRRGQAFEADLTQYDTKQQGVIKKAIDSGILNNTNRTHEFVDIVAKISADKGVLFDFTNNQKLKDSGFAVEGKQVNGFVTKDGITLNIDSPKAWQSTVGHEITHVLEGTELYNELQKTLFNYAESRGELGSKWSALKELYKDVKDADVNKELTADLVGEYLFTDSDFINNLSANNRNVFQKIYDEIKYLYKVATAGSKEARELEKVKKAFDEAYRANGKTSEVKADNFYDSETKYSLRVADKETLDFLDNQETVTTYKTMQLVDGKLYPPMASRIEGKFEDYSELGEWEQATEHPELIKSGNKFKLDKGKGQGSIEAAYNPYMHSSNLVLNDQFSGAYKRDNLVTVECEVPVSELTSGYHAEFAKDSVGWHPWHTGTVAGQLRNAKGTERQVLLSRWIKPVRIVPDSEVASMYKELLDGTNVEVPDNVVTPSLLNELKKAGVKIKESGRVKYSLSDSNGKQLTKEQQEFFKDSKVRDDNGNLKVMYHGTPNGDFTVFKDGTYFTENKEYADKYQNPGASSISTGKAASNPKTFEVYLDIKKPFDINDAEARNIFINDYIKGGNAMGINPYLSDAEYAKINSVDWTEGEDLREFLIENGYDYDGLILDEGATGGYGDDVQSKGKSYVVFSPEQVKNIDNLKPTSDPDIRFSLSESVEETKDLMALHNLTEQKLLKSLQLGGLPMPSVAIAKAKDGHSEFGEISLILPRETIDPETSSRNKLYSGDAWTPTYPKVEYKLNSKALKQVRDKINGLVPANIQEFGRLHLDSDNMEDTLNRYNGDMVDAFKDNDALKYAYLMEAEADVQLPMKEKNLSYSGSRENGAIIKVAEAISSEDISKALNGGHEEIQKLEPIVRKAVAEYVRETYGDDLFILDTFAPEEGLSFSDLDGYLTEARKYHRTGIEQTVDTRPARELIRDMTVQYSYEEWLNNLFSGIVEKEGIRNNKDYFTPSGNRRSFEALHYEHNLENVVKAMREKGEKGIGFGGGNIFGAATTEFPTIKDMKSASDRLQQMSEEEYQEIKEGFSNRFFALASSLPKNKNSFTATDDAATTLTEAVAKYQTRRGIANYLRRELDGWATYSEQVVDDLIELVNDIRKMPTGYFEAKPQRAVGFEEVGVFIIPNNANYKLKQELLGRGYSIAEYDPNVEGDRTRVLNQFEEYKFSLSNVGEETGKTGQFATPATELRLTTEDSTEVAPVKESLTTEPSTLTTDVAKAGYEAPVTAADMQELFPDNAVSVQEELERLDAHRKQLYGALETAVTAGSAEDVGKLAEEYEEVNNRIRELEQEENERTGSLTDAPPEMDAPFYGESETQTVDNPFDERDWDNVGNRKVKAYMYENPEVKPFFQAEAQNLLGELTDTQKGEKFYNDQTYYDSGGEKGWMGVKRLTSESIETLLDGWGMSYADIEKGLNAIIEDNGAENIAAAKKIEFMLNDRLLNGYKNFYDNGYIEPNQDYINLLNEKQINSYSKEAFDSFMQNADMYAPVEPVKPLEKATPDTMDAPVYESKEPGAAKGQTTMFAPEKPKTSGRVANVLTEEAKVDKEKPGIGSKVIAALVDKGAAVEKLSHETGNHELQAKYQAALPSTTEAKAQYFMENGADGVMSLKDIRKEVDRTGKTEDFFNYLYHRHNVDRMSLEARFGVPNKAVYGDSVTAEKSTGIAERLERANPEFKNMAEDIYAYNKHLRKMLVDGNVISQETADLWEKMYPHYVPIRRVDDSGVNINVALDTNKTGVNAPVQRATGGSSDIQPLWKTMAMRTEQTYRAIARNSFGLELKNTLGSVIESEAGANAGVDEMIDTIEKQEDLLKPGTMASNPTFTVFENGERVEFEITEDLYDALKPAGKILGHRFENSNKAAVRFVGNGLDARRNLLTTWNPVFALYRNPIKDIQDVAINSQHALKTYANVPNAIYQIATDGKWATEYAKNGGKSNTYFDSRKGKFVPEDSVFKKTIGMPLKALEAAGEFIEEIPRLAEYIASRQEGRSVERSMLDAARVTTNFAAGGDFTKFLNSHGFTFLNASVQGAAQHVRNFREAKQQGLKGYVKVLAKYTMAGLPGILLNNLLWDDDEEYEELNDYVKQNYYVVAKTKDGKFVRIPKGRTAAVMHNAMEQMEHLVTGDDEADFGTFYELFMNNIAPSNPLENNIIAPIGQVLKNEAWYGGDLVPSRLQKLPAEEQFDESTDSISKWLGEKTGLSPYKINYLIDQYSGGVGDMILPTLTPEAESGDNSFMGNMLAPWKKELTTDSVLNNRNPGDFYDLRDELEVKSNSKDATEEDGLRSMYMDSVSWEMSDLYAKKREIQSSDLPDDEKYEAVRGIQEEINALAKNAMENNHHVQITGLYSEAGDRRYNQDVESGKWYEIKPKNADGSDNWYYQKEQEVTKGLGITPEEYWNNREEYNFAYDKPGKYAMAQAVGGYDTYMQHYDVLENWQSDSYLKADKDSEGNSISGSRKEKVIDYINGLDADYGTKIILYRSVYESKADKKAYNQDIIDYLNERDDISYEQMEHILKELGFEVDSEGYITW